MTTARNRCDSRDKTGRFVVALSPKPSVNQLLAVLLASMVCVSVASFASAGDIDALEQAAIREAVDRVAPAVVRLETIGGLERAGQVLFGTGPTTGLVVDPDGYIVSSAFNFVNKPESILVRLPDGSRKPAKLVATDHSRMLVLLKIDVDKPLPAVSPFSNGEGQTRKDSPHTLADEQTRKNSPRPLGEGQGVRAAIETVPLSQIHVGQWAIAVGRTFEPDQPNMAVGILSALNRVWGKAIQTDAAVSPNNYGGPLVDIRGRVLGVLVPLSPDAADEMAGIEWYDSGIGFAIPMEHVERTLPRLKKGEDLYPGRAGFSLKGTNVYTGEPIIGACSPRGPAAVAGIRPGDKVIEIDGRKIVRAADIKEALGRRYAGDKIQVVVLRDKAPIPFELALAAKLEPFQHGFLGVLPMRTPDPQGVAVRYVYPDSPAAVAGIASGDTIVSLNGEPVTNPAELRLKIGAMEPGAEVELKVRRGQTERTVKAALAQLPEALPPKELQAAASAASTEVPPADRPQSGEISLKAPEYPNKVWAYVPDPHGPNVSYGVVVWLHGTAGLQWPALLAQWKPLCDRYGLILVAPKSADPARWTSREAALVDRLLIEVAGRYQIDPARIVLHGQEGGGSLAFLAAFRNRELISAVAAVEAKPTGQPPENDPLSRLAVYVATADKSPTARPVQAAVAAWRGMKIPVTVKPLGDAPRSLDPGELAELARWIDMLDRI